MPVAHLWIALALAPVPAPQAGWDFVTESDALRSYVETRTIRREGAVVTYWTERRFEDVQELGGERFDRSRHLSRANCQTISTSVVEANFYLGEKAVVIPLRLDPEPMTPEPGDVVAREIAYACRGGSQAN